MKKLSSLLCVLTLAFSCTVENEEALKPEFQEQEIPINEIDAAITNSLEKTGDFSWSSVSSSYISSAANHFDIKNYPDKVWENKSKK